MALESTDHSPANDLLDCVGSHLEGVRPRAPVHLILGRPVTRLNFGTSHELPTRLTAEQAASHNLPMSIDGLARSALDRISGPVAVFSSYHEHEAPAEGGAGKLIELRLVGGIENAVTRYLRDGEIEFGGVSVGVRKEYTDIHLALNLETAAQGRQVGHGQRIKISLYRSQVSGGFFDISGGGDIGLGRFQQVRSDDPMEALAVAVSYATARLIANYARNTLAIDFACGEANTVLTGGAAAKDNARLKVPMVAMNTPNYVCVRLGATPPHISPSAKLRLGVSEFRGSGLGLPLRHSLLSLGGTTQISGARICIKKEFFHAHTDQFLFRLLDDDGNVLGGLHVVNSL